MWNFSCWRIRLIELNMERTHFELDKYEISSPKSIQRCNIQCNEKEKKLKLWINCHYNSFYYYYYWGSDEMRKSPLHFRSRTCITNTFCKQIWIDNTVRNDELMCLIWSWNVLLYLLDLTYFHYFFFGWIMYAPIVLIGTRVKRARNFFKYPLIQPLLNDTFALICWIRSDIRKYMQDIHRCVNTYLIYRYLPLNCMCMFAIVCVQSKCANAQLDMENTANK